MSQNPTKSWQARIGEAIDRDGPQWAGFKLELEDILYVERALTKPIGEPGLWGVT